MTLPATLGKSVVVRFDNSFVVVEFQTRGDAIRALEQFAKDVAKGSGLARIVGAYGQYFFNAAHVRAVFFEDEIRGAI